VRKTLNALTMATALPPPRTEQPRLPMKVFAGIFEATVRRSRCSDPIFSHVWQYRPVLPLLILRAKTQKKKASPPKIAQLQAIAMIAQASRCLHFKMLTARPE
jgi:hypothetical protein